MSTAPLSRKRCFAPTNQSPITSAPTAPRAPLMARGDQGMSLTQTPLMLSISAAANTFNLPRPACPPHCSMPPAPFARRRFLAKPQPRPYNLKILGRAEN